MAQPIRLELPPRDPRAELRARLDAAPMEHAEALLSAYEVLQLLHDRGVLEIGRGLLGSGDKVLEIGVDLAKSPESVRGMRNLLLVANALGDIEPEALAALVQPIPHAIRAMGSEQQKPPGLWRLATGFLFNRDVRRALAAGTALLGEVGRNLAHRDGPRPKGEAV